MPMKTIRILPGRAAAILLGQLLAFAHMLAAPASSSFTYQDQLVSIGGPVNGSYEFTFKLYDALTDGLQRGATLTNAPVTVTNSVFTTTLDFGFAPFDGTALWLELGVRAAGDTNPFTTLPPRQSFTATPYALFALNAATPTQLIVASNSLQTLILQGLSSQSNNVMALSNALSGQLAATNGLAVNPILTNPTNYGAIFAAPTPLAPPAITIQSTGTNFLSGVTLQNGWWTAPYGAPVAYFQPITTGVPMPFDLMPKGPLPADSWMDICDRDVSINNASLWESMRIRKHANDYAEIGTSTLGGSYRDLYLQPLASLSGAKVGIGSFDSFLRPRYMTQIRPSANLNLGIGTANSGILLASVNDNNSAANPLTARASKFLFSSDPNFSPLVYFQIRPTTNVNFSIDNLGGAARLAAFIDNGLANSPIVYQAQSHSFTTDNGTSFGMALSNNVLTATTVVVNKALALGGPSASGQTFTVNGTSGTSRPWPAMTTRQRDAILPPPTAGASILNTDLAQPELADAKGHWYRFGQRPALASTASASTVVTDAMDVLLVKGAGPRSVLLPSPSLCTNRVVEIKDAAFVASTGNIFITSPSGKVENAGSLVIATDGGSVRLVTDGTDWFKLN